MLKDFRAFLLRGNVLDLAVAVVVGAAFGAVVKAFVDDVLMPIITIPFGKPSFDSLSWSINGTTIPYGGFLTALVTFVLIAAAVFFVVVKPVQAMQARAQRGQRDPDATERACPECTSMIAIAARRCPHCTSEIAPLAT